MKLSVDKLKQIMAPGVWLLAGALLVGCGHTPYADPVNPAHPFTFPGQSPSTAAVQPAPPTVNPNPLSPPVGTQNPVPMPSAAAGNPNLSSSILHVGDLITITFADLPPPFQIPEHKERIREDGRITLPYNITVVAAGKTAGQLQQEIRTNYVPALFIHLTVTVKTEERFYFVGGEVKIPARLQYAGEITVLRAIESAGGFTDFAKRSKVLLTRANGEKHTINCDKARKDTSKDLPVYPGDYIYVPRRGI